MQCKRCNSSSIGLVNQYTINLFENNSYFKTEYLNIDSRENLNKRLADLFNGYEFDFYWTGSYESCDECDNIQNHNVITQRKMAYGF